MSKKKAKILHKAPAVGVQRHCSAFIVSVVMTRILPTGVVNTQNKLWWIQAKDAQEAHEKAAPLAASSFPEHKLHTVCSYELGHLPNVMDEGRRTQDKNMTQDPIERCLHPVCSVLLPCPFCGCRAVTTRRHIGPDTIAVIVKCGSRRCPVHPETSPCNERGILRGREGAREVWNHRPNVQDHASDGA